MTKYARFSNFSATVERDNIVRYTLIFTRKGEVEFEVNKGQESYKIGSFTKSNAWGVFKDGVSKFKKGTRIDCYSLSGINEFLLD